MPIEGRFTQGFQKIAWFSIDICGPNQLAIKGYIIIIFTIETLKNFYFIYAASLQLILTNEAQTNLSKQDETWAEFSTLDVGVLVYAAQSHS